MLIDIGNEARQHGEPFTMEEFWPRGMKHVLLKADALDMEQVQLDLTESRGFLSRGRQMCVVKSCPRTRAA